MEGRILKIAVSYDEQTGEVFQHFGHADAFKIYEFDDNGLAGSMQLDTSAINGHEAMALFLSKGGVKVLICGGIGEGAMLALSEKGILVVPGVTGEADVAVARFLQGALAIDTVPNCDHHGQSAGGCDCGGGCGGCHGCH